LHADFKVYVGDYDFDFEFAEEEHLVTSYRFSASFTTEELDAVGKDEVSPVAIFSVLSFSLTIGIEANGRVAG